MITERIVFLDVCKGIMMFMVVWTHICNGYIDYYQYTQPVEIINYLKAVDVFWHPFFMPAFFIITGWCSDFCKRVDSFLLGNVKGLLIPAFTYGLIAHFLGILTSSSSYSCINAIFAYVSTFFIDGPMWFIAALFIAKLLYFFLNLLFPNCVINRSIFLALFMLIGFACSRRIHDYNYWSFQHALLLIPFIEYGRFLRTFKNDKYLDMLGMSYVLVLPVFLLNNIKLPFVVGYIRLYLEGIIPWFWLAVTGSTLILQISKRLKFKSILVLVNKHSIAIYVLHFIIIARFVPMTTTLHLPFVVIFVFAILFVMASCIGISSLLNTKFLKWTIGR